MIKLLRPTLRSLEKSYISILNSSNRHHIKCYCSLTAAKIDGKGDGKKYERKFLSRTKNVVLLLAYNGEGYMGMQRNVGLKTIEEELLQALLNSQIITDKVFEQPERTISFERASRTDKGVSAAFQIVSFKLNMPLSPNLVEEINSHLPPTIKVFGMKQVRRNFDCHRWCESRIYSYMLPTFAFVPFDQITTKDFRITESLIHEINSVLKEFVGAHRYHNFTQGKDARDASSIRHITEMKCSLPFVQENLEFVRIYIKGRSFLLNQIRKMIGLAIAIVRGIVPKDIIEKAWESPRRDFPRAPGLGLVLEEIFYTGYNRKYTGRGMFEALSWQEVQPQRIKFRDEIIYSRIAIRERTEQSMMKWLVNLLECTYDVRDPETPPEIPFIRSPIGKVAYCLKELEEETRAATEDQTQEMSNDKNLEKSQCYP